jgi:hypothetical protein
MGFGAGRISDESLGPIQRLLFTPVVSSHVPVGSFDVRGDHMGARELFDELADTTAADGPIKALVNGLANRDGELAIQWHCLSVLYTPRMKVMGTFVEVALYAHE